MMKFNVKMVHCIDYVFGILQLINVKIVPVKMPKILLIMQNADNGYHLVFLNHQIHVKIKVIIQFYVLIIQKIIILQLMRNVKHGILSARLNLDMLVLMKITVQIIKLKVNVNINKRQIIVIGILLLLLVSKKCALIKLIHHRIMIANYTLHHVL